MNTLWQRDDLSECLVLFCFVLFVLFCLLVQHCRQLAFRQTIYQSINVVCCVGRVEIQIEI